MVQLMNHNEKRYRNSYELQKDRWLLNCEFFGSVFCIHPGIDSRLQSSDVYDFKGQKIVSPLDRLGFNLSHIYYY